MQEKKQNKKPQWDGRTRPSNDLYKKNYDEIFKKKKITDENAEELVHGQNESEEAN